MIHQILILYSILSYFIMIGVWVENNTNNDNISSLISIILSPVVLPMFFGRILYRYFQLINK